MHRHPAVRAMLAVLALALAAAALATPAGATTRYRPRIGGALGLEPRYGTAALPTSSASIPVAYHGGQVMRDVTIHTVFWAPSGYSFDGSPAAGVPGYQALIQQFFADVAHDSGATGNVFSLLDQYGDGSGNGGYDIHYAPAADSFTDTHAYPAQAQQCASPGGVSTCVSDEQIQREVDRLIGPGNSAERGLGNVWFVLLPPDVDTCTTAGSCGTTAYAGYHAAFDLGTGPTVYSVIPDPLIELTPPPGSDPEGNPEAESTINTVGHETVEAITNPYGDGWMDPNGFEVADKCEIGPEQGQPLGYAADGSPYNQVIDGHQYLIQDVWSDSRNGCVQSSTTVASTPSLHTIDLRQFSAALSGNIGSGSRVAVSVGLVRDGVPVAQAQTESRAGGGWGPVILRGPDGRPHAVGDDRDELEVLYGFGPGSPAPDFVATGDGGNPFTEAGYTGWFDLDSGFAVHAHRDGASVTIGPCAQTGMLSLRVGGRLTGSPTTLCQDATSAAQVSAGRITAATPVTLTSEDNRGEYLLRPNGTLVDMTVGLGEPGSVSALNNSLLPFTPTGFPTCTAFLRIRTVRCQGLVAHAAYTLHRGGRTLARGRAGSAGAVTMPGLAVHGGDVLTLVNAAGRRLTSLHVARLRVHITGAETVASSGTCQAGDYWGRPVSKPPNSSQIGAGIAGTGTICPVDGSAKGLPVGNIVQTDDFSGGATETQVPHIQAIGPLPDETLYGPFIASAQSALPGPHGTLSARGVPISLAITPAGSTHRVFFARNVDTAAGVKVPALAPGTYAATWVLHDAAGDTRTLTTRFADEG